VSTLSLDRFHEISRNIDYRVLLESLLEVYNRGEIADPTRRQEQAALEEHLHPLTAAWDRLLPPFPTCSWRRRSLGWEHHRGRRDAYLKQLVITTVQGMESTRRLIVNPATVFGRHARWLARHLPSHEVIGTDIDPTWNRLYHLLGFWKVPALSNYRFVQENVFEPEVRQDTAVVTFFGACGSVTDGCMDLAIGSGSPFLICRSCCHDNIGGNAEIVRRSTPINTVFALKNQALKRALRKEKYRGFYVSDRYKVEAYPRSAAAREVLDPDTVLTIARNSVDSDICRTLIDLDRCLFLQEHGYDVLYREELFFAHRTGREMS
jgi:hypothetical protein